MTSVRTTILIAALIVAGGAAAASSARERRSQPGAHPFIQAGSCYRIAFPIDGPPNYKVLEVIEGGWVRAEVDAGTAKAQRPSMWINTAQVITLREVRCSE